MENITVMQIINLLGIIAGAVTSAGVVYSLIHKLVSKHVKNNFDEYFEQYKETFEDLKKTNLEHTEAINKFKEDINLIESRNSKQDEEHAKTRQLIMLFTRHQLVESCNRYLTKGHIDSTALQSIIELYDYYHEVLGGNSYVTALVEKVKNLEIKDI